MSKTKSLPTSLIEAIRYFSDLDVCTEFVAKLRWPNGPVCPKCGGVEYSYLKTRRLWKCRECKKQYSVKLGTIFEDSPLGLDKWLPAVWLAANSKNGISSHELGRALGITQKSAWFMLQRIRLAMQTGSFNKLDGEVEVDETFIGGKARNMHKSVRDRKGPRTGWYDKTVVLGCASATASYAPRSCRTRRPRRSSRRSRTTSLPVRRSTPTTATPTEALDAPTTIVRSITPSSRVHTNGLENFWSLLKRGLNGTYVSVEPFHLFRYLDERVFTYNKFDWDDYGRFSAVLGMAAGRRLTYAELTGRVSG
ncbi:MAG: hypothetical protein QOD71_3067 [Thermoleophilaceae bacterium]|nr:hypothetical protein [Thermoleophilaceae bacterium]